MPEAPSVTFCAVTFTAVCSPSSASVTLTVTLRLAVRGAPEADDVMLAM